MNIAYVAEGVPYPLTAGIRHRRFHLLRAYAEAGWRVSLFALCRDAAERQAAEALREYCSEICLIPFETTLGVRVRQWSRWRRYLSVLSATDPSSIRRYESEAMREALVSRRSVFDVVHFSRIASVPYLGVFEDRLPARPLCVLDLDELESSVRGRELEAGFHATRRTRLLARIELRRLRAYEQRVLPRVDLVLVCSEVERATVPLPDVSVVSNGIELPPEPPAAGGGDGRTLLFVGFMDYPPNADAARFLVGDILPRVRRVVPGARAVLVGRTSSEAVRRLHDGETAVVRGEVSDLRPHYENASVVVAPLRVGGGTRIKILEAFAWRRPVVSTSVGAEGLRINRGYELFVEDTPDGFAARCIALLNDASLRGEMARRAVSVAERYQWSSIRTTFARIIEQRLREGGAAAWVAPEEAR